MDEYRKSYELWRARVTDAALRGELDAIEGDDAAIEDRFYRELSFGTGGLRGVLGVGTNRMNVYVVARATRGLCRWLRESGAAPEAAVSCDSRVNSRLFAQTAAGVFAAEGVRVHIFPQLMPTPCLSFATRYLGCGVGVMITASHNGAAYNGYKVYGADGCQITDDAAAAIAAHIRALDPFAGTVMPYAAALAAGLAEEIGAAVTDAYLAALDGACLYAGGRRDMPVVYTPLHGAGVQIIPRALAAHGFTNVILPPAQSEPDGRFPTCPQPNPELPQALDEALRCAREHGAALVLASDPDGDRVGVAVERDGAYVRLSGNQTGVLLLDYLCRLRRERGTLPPRAVVVKTIVTTPLADRIARRFGCEVINTLTGFKYIGEAMGRLEARGELSRFLFGFEESCGGLTCPAVRDKDAANFSLLLAEMFVWHREQGRTLLDALEELYREYGYYTEQTLSFDFPGSAGLARMRARMAALRAAPPARLGDRRVTAARDYLRCDTGLPRSDVLQYELEGGALVTVRPSGTEPKLKLYLSCRSRSAAQGGAEAEELAAALRERLE